MSGSDVYRDFPLDSLRLFNLHCNSSLASWNNWTFSSELLRFEKSWICCIWLPCNAKELEEFQFLSNKVSQWTGLFHTLIHVPYSLFNKDVKTFSSFQSWTVSEAKTDKLIQLAFSQKFNILFENLNEEVMENKCPLNPICSKICLFQIVFIKDM